MTYTRLSAVFGLLVFVSLAACRQVPAAGGAPAAGTASAASSATAAPAAAQPAPVSPAAPEGGTVTGSVGETMNSGGYTYVKLQTGKDDVWIAATEFAVKIGDRLTVALEMPMANFHSKTLNRDFPMLYFVSNVSRGGETLVGARGPEAGSAAPIDMMGSHQSAAATATPVEPIPPASGGLTIADVWAQRKALAGKSVVVRGKVVKVNDGIMGRNWLHLQDGSGSATDRTNDLTITTAAEVKLGDVVTVSGVLAVGKDFGSGYAYEAILENAKVTGK